MTSARTPASPQALQAPAGAALALALAQASSPTDLPT